MSALRGAATLLLRTLAAAFTLLIAAYASIKSLAALLDPDIWLHIRTGQWISEHHALPHNAIFSQYSERSWVAYSWGFDLLVSGVTRVFGLAGIPEVLIVLQILLSLVLFLSLSSIGGRFWVAWLATTLAVYSDYTAAFRPAHLTSLFLTLELLLIFEVERRREDRLLFWIAPIFLLWVNCHIQFVYGLFVLGLYAFCRTVPLLMSCVRAPQGDLHEPEWRGAVKPWLAFVLAALACCVGPYGILPFKVAFIYAGDARVYRLIQELAANDFRHPEDYTLLLLVMAGAWALGRRRRFDLFRVSLLAISAMISFRSIRDAWFVSIIAAFMLVETFRSEPELDVVARRQPIRNGVVFALGTAATLAIAFSIASRQGLDMTSLSVPVNVMFPVRAKDFIRASGLQGPMFNPFNWGDFLIYNLPEQPVSMDGRLDVYRSDLVSRNIETQAGNGWQNDPDLSRANFVLLQRVSPLAAILVKTPGYRLVYQDALAVIFVRQNSPRASPKAPDSTLHP